LHICNRLYIIIKAILWGKRRRSQLTALEENYNIRFRSKATATCLRWLMRLVKHLWIYEPNCRGCTNSRLKLLKARSWRYDRLPQQHNTAEPKPEQVKMLLENLGQLQKTPNKKEQQDSDIGIREMAEPYNRNPGG
jgi:hypothetical protein